MTDKQNKCMTCSNHICVLYLRVYQQSTSSARYMIPMGHLLKPILRALPAFKGVWPDEAMEVVPTQQEQELRAQGVAQMTHAHATGQDEAGSSGIGYFI